MVKKGLLTHIGAHGEPPLGLNYHAEMFYAFWGLLDNYEVCRLDNQCNNRSQVVSCLGPEGGDLVGSRHARTPVEHRISRAEEVRRFPDLSTWIRYHSRRYQPK